MRLSLTRTGNDLIEMSSSQVIDPFRGWLSYPARFGIIRQFLGGQTIDIDSGWRKLKTHLTSQSRRDDSAGVAILVGLSRFH